MHSDQIDFDQFQTVVHALAGIQAAAKEAVRRPTAAEREAKRVAAAKAEKARVAKARRDAQGLAKRLGVTLDRDGDEYWVWGPADLYGSDGDDDRDPLVGCRFRTDWFDVLEAVRVYLIDMRDRGDPRAL
jgi:hypothetical protein